MLLHDILYLNSFSERLAESALVDADEKQDYSFGFLREQAEGFCAYLNANGLVSGDRIAILARKSPQTVAAFLGSSLADITFVPLDPAADSSYWKYIVKELGIKAVLSDLGDLDDVFDPVPVLNMSGKARPIACRRGDTAGRSGVNDPAYILTTSGSTGTPKGVVLSHENALAFVRWASGLVELKADDTVLNVAPFHFDLSVFDIYASLMVGARLVIAPASASMFPGQLLDYIERYDVSVIYAVPTLLAALANSNAFSEGAGNSLRTIMYAGEPFPVPSLRRLMKQLPHVTFYNFFGPTETNVSLAYKVSPLRSNDEEVPIGVEASGISIRLVDDVSGEVEDGEIGEIVAEGPTVMLGYLTKEGFSPQKGPYRTGDFALKREDGVYLFRGRRDAQVKVRGNRIELQAVERVLQSVDNVSEAVSLARNDLHVAFVACDEVLEERMLREACKKSLPPGSIPHRFIILEGFPRLSNGKVDRVELERMAEFGDKND